MQTLDTVIFQLTFQIKQNKKTRFIVPCDRPIHCDLDCYLFIIIIISLFSSHFNHQHTRSITYFLIYFSLNWAFIFFVFLLIFIFSITYVRKQERKLIQYWILTWFKRDWTELYGFTQFPVLRRSEAMTELGWRGGERRPNTWPMQLVATQLARWASGKVSYCIVEMRKITRN